MTMRFKPTHKRFSLTVTAAVAALALAVAGCGDDGSDSANSSASSDQTDAMFVTGMIPHHQSAIEMAELALKEAKHDEIKQLSENIIESQQAEIETLERLKDELPETHESMMSDDQMQAMMSDVEELKNADDFDKAFIDAMVPHHQSAVVMANRVKNSSNQELAALAAAIIKAQTAEIEDMREWREQWYGSAGPSGASAGGSMGHGDMHGM